MTGSGSSAFLEAPSYADIVAASERLAGRAVVTPLLESPLLNERIGGRLLLKAEALQRTGSFKFRGAYNRLSQIPDAERAKGVVAFSSGNHAQGVAAAAGIAGIPAIIVMPKDAPVLKIANTRRLGAEVVLYDRFTEDREAIASEIARTRGATLIKPYDDGGVIAGQGTVGLELAEQAKDVAADIDAVLVPCSGGGLASGIATALAHDLPGTEVYAVEPAGFDDTALSLVRGERVAVATPPTSICDALLVPIPGLITFGINRRLLTGSLVVSDDDALAAMEVAFQYLKIVLEPGGAVGLAAVLGGAHDGRGKTTVVIGSGGNVDARTFARALERAGA